MGLIQLIQDKSNIMEKNTDSTLDLNWWSLFSKSKVHSENHLETKLSSFQIKPEIFLRFKSLKKSFPNLLDKLKGIYSK